MFRIVCQLLHWSAGGRYRLVPCDCFELVPLPAFLEIDMPQLNLIIAACAAQHLFSASASCASSHGQHAFERQSLFNLPCSADSEMDIFYLILRERSHLFRAESRGLPLHHKAHQHHFISFASLFCHPIKCEYMIPSIVSQN